MREAGAAPGTREVHDHVVGEQGNNCSPPFHPGKPVGRGSRSFPGPALLLEPPLPLP